MDSNITKPRATAKPTGRKTDGRKTDGTKIDRSTYGVRGRGGGAYSFVACLRYLTIDHTSRSKRSTVLTPINNRELCFRSNSVPFPIRFRSVSVPFPTQHPIQHPTRPRSLSDPLSFGFRSVSVPIPVRFHSDSVQYPFRFRSVLVPFPSPTSSPGFPSRPIFPFLLSVPDSDHDILVR